MNPEPPYADIQSRLSRIEETLNKIDKTLHPPFWKKLLRWIGRNFFTLVLLIIVLFLAYKGWEMYQNVLSSIDEIKSMPANAIDSGKDVLEDVVDTLRFW